MIKLNDIALEDIPLAFRVREAAPQLDTEGCNTL